MTRHRFSETIRESQTQEIETIEIVAYDRLAVVPASSDVVVGTRFKDPGATCHRAATLARRIAGTTPLWITRHTFVTVSDT